MTIGQMLKGQDCPDPQDEVEESRILCPKCRNAVRLRIVEHALDIRIAEALDGLDQGLPSHEPGFSAASELANVASRITPSASRRSVTSACE